jgi:hypothetical protein
VPVITDFSQIYLAPIHVDGVLNDAVRNRSDENKNIIKHVVYNSLRARYKEFRGRYGDELVIACDERSWRKGVFPEYKWKRAENKKSDTSGIDWDFVFEVQGEMISEINEYFPFVALKVAGCEGDDIIGTLTKHWLTENVEENLFGESEPPEILIISSDKDNFQCHVHKNVKQWSPLTKKLVKPEIPAKEYLVRKIVGGDAGDGIPNIRMANDTFVTGTRQLPIKEAFATEFVKRGVAAAPDETIAENYRRNEMLISYDKIPEKFSNSIIMEYNNRKAMISQDKMKLMSYFSERRMNQLFANISDFF